jgi:hypothetical protein
MEHLLSVLAFTFAAMLVLVSAEIYFSDVASCRPASMTSPDIKTIRAPLSHSAVLLALVLPQLVVGETLAQSQAGAPHITNLYPGRYVAVCKPAPIIGCLCSSDSHGEISVFPELTGAADHRLEDVKDTEYLQMVTWLRRTCASLTRPTNLE